MPDARRRSRSRSGRRGRRGRREGPRRMGGSEPRTYWWARDRSPALFGPPRAPLALGVRGLREPAAVTPAATGDAGPVPASYDLCRPRQGQEKGSGKDGQTDCGPSARVTARNRAIGGGCTLYLYYIPRRGGTGLRPLAAQLANRRYGGAGPRARGGGRGAGTKERRLASGGAERVGRDRRERAGGGAQPARSRLGANHPLP